MYITKTANYYGTFTTNICHGARKLIKTANHGTFTTDICHGARKLATLLTTVIGNHTDVQAKGYAGR